jgi:uncharacterized RDD family membrane protein YckC
MSASPDTPDDPGLFDDLPLRSGAHLGREPISAPEPPELPSPRSRPGEEPRLRDARTAEGSLLLFDEEPPDKNSPRVSEATPASVEGEPLTDRKTLARLRLLAGLLDLSVVVAVAISIIGCVAWMGVELSPLPGVPLALFLIVFSFLYCVFPLAFWGRTTGMACLGLRARSLDGRSLSFRQTAWRWLAGLLTVASFGLPLVLTLKGSYLSDLLSKSDVEAIGD